MAGTQASFAHILSRVAVPLEANLSAKEWGKSMCCAPLNRDCRNVLSTSSAQKRRQQCYEMHRGGDTVQDLAGVQELRRRVQTGIGESWCSNNLHRLLTRRELEIRDADVFARANAGLSAMQDRLPELPSELCPLCTDRGGLHILVANLEIKEYYEVRFFSEDVDNTPDSLVCFRLFGEDCLLEFASRGAPESFGGPFESPAHVALLSVIKSTPNIGSKAIKIRLPLITTDLNGVVTATDDDNEWGRSYYTASAVDQLHSCIAMHDWLQRRDGTKNLSVLCLVALFDLLHSLLHPRQDSDPSGFRDLAYPGRNEMPGLLGFIEGDAPSADIEKIKVAGIYLTPETALARIAEVQGEDSRAESSYMDLQGHFDLACMKPSRKDLVFELYDNTGYEDTDEDIDFTD